MSDRKAQKVKPQILKGFRDYPPDEMIARNRMLTNVQHVCELMGFLPLQTPSIERADVLLGSHYSEDSLGELFGFAGPDEVDMALRYEFTLSLARYVAGSPTLALPFRRYQYGNVWRVDKPGPGRYREFMQFDLDIVGTQNLLADAEIIAAMVTIFKFLGIDRFVVRFSNRKILNGLLQHVGIPSEQGADVLRVIDKLEKQGKAAVLLELGPGRVDSSGDKIKGLNLSDTHIQNIESFLNIASQNEGDPLARVEAILGDIEIAKAGIQELRDIQTILSGMNVDASKLSIDLTIVRGLGYYTGPVFETTLLDLPEFGSVFSGGRYDNLVERFLNRTFPAVGASIGVDRLLAALIHLKALTMQSATAKVLVTVMDRDRLTDYLEMLRELRNEGIAAEIFSGDTKNITKQIAYADKIGIPLVVIAGSDEFARGEITVKNLIAGRKLSEQTTDREEWLKASSVQQTIPRTQLVLFIRQQLHK